MRTHFFITAFMVAVTCRAQTGAGYHKESGSMATVIQNYNTDVEDLNKVYLFRDSPEYYERMGNYYNEALQRLKALSFSRMPVSEQVDFLLLKRNITKAKKDLEESEKVYRQISYAFPFAEKIMAQQKDRRRGKAVNAPEAAALFSSIKNDIAGVRLQLQKAPALPAPLAKKAGDVIEALRRGIQNTFGFYNAYDPLFTWWAKKPYEEADSALALYATFIKSKAVKEAGAQDDGSGIVGNPIGAEALKELLRFEMIPYTPEELVAMATANLRGAMPRCSKLRKRPALVPTGRKRWKK